jgi:bifunctional DNA-binding transcriptional regulator/antitoxin component of YhaV-PrlF toxin-antitoxin module
MGIPKKLRKQLKIQPGQKISLAFDKNKNISVSTASLIEQLQKQFGGRNIWGKDPVVTIRKARNEWDN